MSQPIYVLNSYGRNLVLKINDLDNNYNQLKYYFEDSKEDIQTILIDKEIIEIDKLNVGKYTIYAYSSKTRTRSDEIEVYIQNYDYQARVDKLWKLAEIEEDEYNNTLKRNLLKQLRHNPEYSLLYILCQTFHSIEDLEDFERELFFKLIIIQEKYENLEASNYNRYNGFNIFKNGPIPKVTIEGLANVIKIYKVISPNERILDRIYKNVGTEQELYFDEDTLFEIEILNNNDLVTKFRHFHFDYDGTLRLWNSINDFLEEYENITEDLFQMSSNSKMDSTETKMYLIERNMFPNNEFIPRVAVSYPHYNKSIDLTISNNSYMKTSEHKFYLSGRDVEFLDDPNAQFFEIKSDYNSYTVKFDPVYNMIDKEALLYITDENGTIVNKITRAIFSDDDYENYTDYYEKIRSLEVNDYNDNLIKYISNTCPQFYDVIQDTAYEISENTDISTFNILESTIALIDNKYTQLDKNKLFYEILKNHFVNTNYNSQFFTDKGFTYEPYTYKVITEESDKGYILCILAKELNDEDFKRYYIHSFKDRAIELKLNQFGKYIIYAISEEDYKYSGFFYLNTIDNFYKSYLLNQGVR